MCEITQVFFFHVVPNPPRTLLARLKFLEDHLIKLEKEYPPWAALHFNQPGRGVWSALVLFLSLSDVYHFIQWPPPPRNIPIIVPPHLRGTTTSSSDTTPMDAATGPGLGLLSDPSSSKPKPKTKIKLNTKAKSSLHRAVMERLEVQKAMKDPSKLT